MNVVEGPLYGRMTTVIPARMSQILGTVQGTIAHIIFQTQNLVVFSIMKHLVPQMYAAPVEEAWSTMMTKQVVQKED